MRANEPQTALQGELHDGANPVHAACEPESRTSLWSIVGRGITGLKPGSLNEERFGDAQARALRAERLSQVFAMTPTLMVCNILIAGLCWLAIFGQGRDLASAAWFATICLVAGYGLYAAFRRDPGKKPSGSQRTTRLIVRQAAMLSLLWTFPVVVLLPIAEGYQGYVLMGVIAAMMAGGAFALAPVPRAALTWLGVCTAANVVAFMAWANPVMLSLAVGTLIWAGLIACNVLRLAVAETRRFADAVASAEQGFALARQRDELAEQRDVIELLLREYEADGGDWRWRTDAQGRLQRAPSELLDILALSPAAAASADCFGFVESLTLSEARGGVEKLRRAVRCRQRFTDLLFAVHDRRRELRGREPRTRWISLSGKPQWSDAGVFDGYRGIAADVTARHETELRVRHLATRDALTGLWNRTSLNDCLNELIRTRRPFAYAQIDLDRFKACNDRLGHQAGDELLCLVARTLEAAAYACAGPDAFVARIGGDEFALVVGNADPAECTDRLKAFASRAVRRIGEPQALEAGTATVGASIGIASYPQHGATAEGVVRAADFALYHAKEQGRGRWFLFNSEMDAAWRERGALERDLRRALERGEMSLAYQPIVSTISAEANAMEALLRWDHPEQGFVPPSTFIPIAEETGIIRELGAWVVREACREAASWRDGRGITVNVSTVQLLRSDFADTVRSALTDARLPATRLEVEVTETALLDDFASALETLNALRDMGVSIALDDFGVGYAGLSYLKEFQFDRIKIDRSFISALLTDEDGAGAIVRALVKLAHSLGMNTTAEGVEHDTQIELLRNLGCEQMQGFLLGRPGRPDALDRSANGEAPRARNIRVAARPRRRVA